MNSSVKVRLKWCISRDLFFVVFFCFRSMKGDNFQKFIYVTVSGYRQLWKSISTHSSQHTPQWLNGWISWLWIYKSSAKSKYSDSLIFCNNATSIQVICVDRNDLYVDVWISLCLHLISLIRYKYKRIH